MKDRAVFEAMAGDEQCHADLARSIVTWCFDQDPAGVGRALARVAPAHLAGGVVGSDGNR